MTVIDFINYETMIESFSADLHAGYMGELKLTYESFELDLDLDFDFMK